MPRSGGVVHCLSLWRTLVGEVEAVAFSSEPRRCNHCLNQIPSTRFSDPKQENLWYDLRGGGGELWTLRQAKLACFVALMELPVLCRLQSSLWSPKILTTTDRMLDYRVSFSTIASFAALVTAILTHSK